MIEALRLLRAMLLRVAGVWAVAAMLLWPVRGALVQAVVLPLAWLDVGHVRWLAVGIGEVFVLDMKLVLGAALALVLPYVLWEIYRFVAPGLYVRERRGARAVLLLAPLVSAGGVLLAWGFLAPAAAGFLLGFGHEGLAVMPRLGDYVGLVLGMAVAAVVALHGPLALALLVRAGFLDWAQVAAARKWVLLAVLLLAAVATPPDPVSMLLLAVPVYGWFELVMAWGRRR